MGGQALHSERACHADTFSVFIRLVVKGFLVGITGNGFVYFFLAVFSQLPPLLMKFLGLFGPFIVYLTGDLTLLP
jgi:hypothetical protein